MMRQAIVIVCLFEVLQACIPTQQVSDPALPCQVCQKIYDKTCTGYVAGQSWCATAATVGITYELGPSELFHFGDENTCLLYYQCPSGTTSRVDVFGLTAPTEDYVAAFCQETGSTAGEWYYGLTDISLWTPMRLKSLSCGS